MSRMRIALGGLSFEANSLSTVAVDVQTFERVWLRRGNALLADAPASGTETGGAVSLFGLYPEIDMVPLLDAAAGAGGYIRREAWERLRDELLARLRDALPIDGLFLGLHGAAVAEGEEDVEGALLEAVREIVGPSLPVAVTLDLHGNITPRMARNATFMVGYRHYPHDDVFDTGRRTAGLLVQTVRGSIRPVMRVRKSPFVAGCQNQRTKVRGPLVDLHAEARAREAAGEALAISYFPVQHGLDFPGVSWGTVVVTDGDAEGADRLALHFARSAWERRHEFVVDTVAPEAAIARGLAIEGGPVVLSEASDCVGGGAYGDSAIVVEALRRRAPEASACIVLTDPETVDEAREAGVGAIFRARLGNKHDGFYGRPLELDVRVRRLHDGTFTYDGGWLAGAVSSMGPAALLEAGPIEILACSEPTYQYAAEQLRAVGVDAWTRKFVVVKNPMNFQQAFAGAPLLLHLDTPGPTTCKVEAGPWQRLDRPIFPLDDGFEPEFPGF